MDHADPVDDVLEEEDFLVVGVGASAGGLEALEMLLRDMPLDSGMAFIVVQHLSPDFKSVMEDLLARVTDITIKMIEDGVRVEPNTIYLLPAKQEVICSNGQLLLTDRPAGRDLSYPIDQLLRSLASDLGKRSVGVILSGTGTDGSRGVRDINKAGGLVVVQEPESAKFDGMPKAALDTGIVDVTVPIDQIEQALLTYGKNHSKHLLSRVMEEQLVMEGPMYVIFHLLKKHCGVDFADYKTTTISRRVHRRLTMAGIPNLDAYVELLRKDNGEVDRLYKDLLIGVTSFFRDRDVFERLREEVIPELFKSRKESEGFRAWVVGTATGEEAYSLAILINEHMRLIKRPFEVKIFATDVHEDSLAAASRGVYQEESFATMPPALFRRYFTEKSDGFHAIPAIRNMVVCVRHNVVRDAPFTKIDLITCRNMLIYLTPPAQRKVLSLFHFALKKSGYMCLGSSESLGDMENDFATVDERNRIFRKQREIRITAATDMPLNIPSPTVSTVRKRATNQERDLLSCYDAALGEFMPPGVLVDKDGNVLHVFKGGGRFLSRSDGRPSTDVLDMVHVDIRATVASALRRIRMDSSPVVFDGLRCEVDGKRVDLRLTVRPMGVESEEFAPRLILFEEHDEASTEPAEVVRLDAQSVSNEEIESLQHELQQTRSNLQATIEQQQQTNEELHATNEQLIASNEELQSTNEELHSVNEELYTVNAEHQRKIDELTELTADMDNLLASTNVHTIFLDRHLRIRRFTPGIAETFNLIPQDVGRRIDTFTHSILDHDLAFEICQVVESELPLEKEVQDRSGRCYLMRILPYVSADTVDGAVLALIDVTTLKQAERRLAEISEIVEHSDDAILRVDNDGIITTWNAGATKLFGHALSDVVGKSVAVLVPDTLREEANLGLQHAISGGSVDRLETKRQCKDGSIIDVSLTLSPIRNEIGDVVGAAEILRDITAQKQAEQEVRAAIRHRDEFLAMLSHELRNPMSAVLNASTLLRENDVDAALELDARDVIERNVRHAARLLDDLLDLSRFTHAKISLHLQVVDLTAMSLDVIDCSQPTLEEKEHELHVQAPTEPLYVEGDVGRLQQAQVNLLVNAAKYTSSGGRIEYSLHKDDAHAVITVRDNGIGIPETFLQQIFEPFVQSEQSLDRSQGGMGLGLPLVKMIVEAHRGDIQVSSSGENQGSTFEVRLPLTVRRPVAKAAIDQDLTGDGKRMLIVEDNEGIRRMMAASMELKGFAVRTAVDGGEAIEAFTDFVPDAAIVDIGLPDVNGYEVARKVRENNALQNVLLIAVSGYGREPDREQAREAGFDLHLVKPVDPNELVQKLLPLLASKTRSDVSV